MDTSTKTAQRHQELTAIFMDELDKHLDDLLHGRISDMYEIRDIADHMHIHPRHLSNTIKRTTGRSACSFFEEKIIEQAKILLAQPNKSIQEIAVLLTYDPSNFTKFFKRFTQLTPKQYRNQILEEQTAENMSSVA
ncbi:helix-turn-helix domain-containing protein [Sphingobacterium spiritivorum]|uniref:helix-turn-helix domain-containing protein n=1 Tax=Sphingobacterium TaxID=28453 RepID=UPI0025E22DD7|nr:MULTISPECIES: helix-turn-helix transcriptional regulator [unclassified Sphingobacterium]